MIEDINDQFDEFQKLLEIREHNLKVPYEFGFDNSMEDELINLLKKDLVF